MHLHEHLPLIFSKYKMDECKFYLYNGFCMIHLNVKLLNSHQNISQFIADKIVDVFIFIFLISNVN